MKTVQFRMHACALPGVHAVEARSGHSFPRHTHDQFGIGVIHAGAQKSLSGRGVVEAGAGAVITVNPGEVHDGMPIGEADRAWNMLYFDPQHITGLLDEFRESWDDFEFQNPVINDARVAGRVRQLFTEMTRADGALASEELALMLFAQLSPLPAGRTASLPPEIGGAKSRIDDDPTGHLTLSELAALTGTSRFQLLRGFAKAVGVTPHAYILQKRIGLARRLIAGGRSLADVAFESGFADQSHMTRLFARNFGVTPGAYAAAISFKT